MQTSSTVAQSLPEKPGSHEQSPPVPQMPWPEQLPGQLAVTIMQSAPAKPAWQLQVPMWQRPEHSGGESGGERRCELKGAG